jgi:thiosulfate dehydrogenase [quinone] large subunit
MASTATATSTLANAIWPRPREAPLRFAGTALLVFLRLFYGLFFFQAGVNKMLKGWGYASYLRDIFNQRLTELNPESFASLYLENFGIPFAAPISFVVAYGELFAGIGLLLGLITRPAAYLALFILLNIAIGGYYDASLLPFFAINITLLFYPLGQKFGLDRYLARRYPGSFLFR